ncbi:MAG: AAA family ATPase [Clostridia bacterium]
MEEKTQILAIMGSPSSGKTTTAVKIATELSNNKKNVIILSLDPSCPTLPYILDATHEKSIGELFTQMQITQKEVLSACVSSANNQYIGMMGYKLGESYSSYPKVIPSKVIDVINELKHLCEYIIIDCSTVIEADVATIISLQVADKVLRIGTANAKGISYFFTADKLLADSKFKKENQLMAIGNFHQEQEWRAVSQQYGGTSYLLPHCKELEVQFNEQNLFEPIKDCEQYNAEILKITRDIFGLEIKAREKPVKTKAKKEKKKISFSFVSNKGSF